MFNIFYFILLYTSPTKKKKKKKILWHWYAAVINISLTNEKTEVQVE